MKKKLLYISPHLSTGGQPQYLYKQIENFIDDFHIEVVELNNSGGDAYVVQKNKIKSLVVLHTLGEDKSKVLDIIDEFKPDIIHFQEIPQFDLPTNVLDKIFSNDRPYFIVSTTHGSFTNPDEIIYHPDRYVLVSKWSQERFKSTEVETQLWEYPIEDLQPDREKVKRELEMNLDYKHVLMVGLFSPGKNQAEIFDVARQMEKYKIKFHFVGNQAMNFENYWLPLMRYKPDNCIIWGERTDVDKFYEACDLFYFSSTLELNPLSIKEALSWKLPCIFRKLHTYMDTYDNNPLVQYINDDLKNTKQILLETLQPEFNEIPGWFSYENIYDDVIKNAPFGANFVEVGAWFGKSTNFLASKIREHKKEINFTTVDTFKGSQDEDLHNTIVNAHDGDIFHDFIDNTILSGNYNSFNIIKDTSVNAASQFKNNSLDFIMLDAGHSYEDLKLDLNTWYKKVKPGGYISGDDYGVFEGVTRAADEFFYGQFNVNFRSFVRRKPRIQVKHLMTRPEDLRERVSMSSLKQLQNYGINYQPIVNQPYRELPPKDFCRRPEHLSPNNQPGELYPGAGLGWITGPHYGCYMAHRGALETMNDDYDYTLIFEADAFIYTGLEEFVDIVHKACFISERDDVYYISLSNNPSRSKTQIDNLFSQTGSNQDLAHAYLIPNRTKGWWLDRIKDCKWDVADLWYNHVFHNHPQKRYTTNKVYSKQAEGFSLLDLTNKTWE